MLLLIIFSTLIAGNTLAKESEPCPNYDDQACIRDYLASVSDCIAINPENADYTFSWPYLEVVFDSFNLTVHRFNTSASGYETGKVTKLLTNDETDQTLIEVTFKSVKTSGEEDYHIHRPGQFDHIVHTTYNGAVSDVSITAIYDGIERIFYESERLYTYFFDDLGPITADVFAFIIPEFAAATKTDPIAKTTLDLLARDSAFVLREEFAYVSHPYFYGYRTKVLCAPEFWEWV